MKPRLRLIFVVSLFLLGTVVGWQAKTWAVERAQIERRLASCDRTYDIARNLIASYVSGVPQVQFTESSVPVGQYSESEESGASLALIEGPQSNAQTDKFHRQSLQNLVNIYGGSCSPAKRTQLQNELEQAFREKDAREREEQTQ